MPKIQKALVSVSDKTGVLELAKFLIKNKIEIISTGGTAKHLKENSIPITPIEKITGNPESFDGRMKTISFQIGSAILFDRNNKKHIEEKEKLNISQIDLVICNLYPFEEVYNSNSDYETLIENIDIGGPNMIRAAAKNHRSLCVLTNTSQYKDFMLHYTANNQSTEFLKRKEWALEAFKLTAKYDKLVFEALSNESIGNLEFQESKELRYGENPHQKSKFIKINNSKNPSFYEAEILGGKELSHNNLMDMDSAWKSSYDAITSQDSSYQCVSIVKHCNPCGIAVSSEQETALELAWAGDPISSFGSIISFTNPLNQSSAKFLSDKFIEVVIAPDYEPDALKILRQKKNLRIIKMPEKIPETEEVTYRSISGGLLVSEEDVYTDREFQNVTETKLDKKDLALSVFGTNVCKHLKSNGICLVSKSNNSFWLTGSGMGQPNRLEALKNLSIPRFNEKKDLEIADSILISDAFFPFSDSIDLANEFGIKKIVQPGGSIRDPEVIAACDKYNISMAFTGRRHFRH